METVERILVSACLLGVPVRYDGRAKDNDSGLLAQWRAEGRLVSFCPEVSGGLPVPRPPAEILLYGPSSALAAPAQIVPGLSRGEAVLDGTARVVTAEGADVTEYFLRGAALALKAASHNAVRLAILKEGSPSCGSHRVYDGSFAGTSVAGFGVTTALLTRNGIRVFSEDELDLAGAYLCSLEQHS